MTVRGLFAILILLVPTGAFAAPGQAEKIAQDLITIRLTDNIVGYKSFFCAKAMGREYGELYDNWVKKSAANLTAISKFIADVELSANIETEVKKNAAEEVKKQIADAGNIPFCRKFKGEMEGGVYDFKDGSPLLGKYDALNASLETATANPAQFQQIKISGLVSGALGYCMLKVKQDPELVAAYENWQDDNAAILSEAEAKFSDGNFLQFLKNSLHKNAHDFLRLSDDQPLACLLLAKKLADGWFSLKDSADKNAFEQQKYMLDGRIK